MEDVVPGPKHGHAQEDKDGILDPREGKLMLEFEDSRVLEMVGFVRGRQRFVLGIPRRLMARESSPCTVHYIDVRREFPLVS